MIKKIVAVISVMISFCLTLCVNAEGIFPELNRELINLYPGQSFRLALTDYSGKYVFTTQNAEVATVDPSGNVTGNNVGITEITCTLAGDKELKCTVNVKSGKSPSSVTLDQQIITLTRGESAQLNARVLPQETGNYMNFSSSDESVVTVDQNGTINALHAGTAVITVESESTAVSAGCFVRVLSDDSDSEFSTDVSGVLYNASGEKLTNMPIGIFSGDSSAKLTTDSNGQFRFEKIKGGTYVLTVYGKNGSEDGISTNIIVNAKNMRLTCILTDEAVSVMYGSNTVTAGTVRDIRVSQKNIRLNSGETYDISCALTPPDAKDSRLFYRSENTDIADVDSSGRITALNEGGTVIFISSSDGRITEKMTVNVTRYGVGMFGMAIFMMLAFIIILIITAFVYLRKKDYSHEKNTER